MGKDSKVSSLSRASQTQSATIAIVDQTGERPRRLIRAPEVCRLTGMSRPYIYALMARKEFPKQIVLGPGCVVWVETEVAEWIAEKIATRSRSGNSDDVASQAVIAGVRRTRPATADRRRIKGHAAA